MESPHHGALDPGSHPRTATEAAHPEARGRRNAIQMYACARVHVCTCTPSSHYCANEGSMQIKIFPAGPPSLCLRGLGVFPLLQENSLKSLKLVSRWHDVPEDVGL